MDTPHPADSTAAKTALRDQVRAARKRRPLGAAADFAVSVADVATGWDVIRRAATVTAYVSVGSEPGTGHLLDALVASGKRVLLPVVLPGLDLDWAEYAGRDSLGPAVRGLLEPTGPRLGREAIGQADVVLVPGLAVSAAGDRLGQGGGCYDRALPRITPGTPVAVVLYDDEVGLAVPTDPHDRPVDFALTSSGVVAMRESPDIR
ncbi:5-formyltetrahydrofolate cyclo-ligase [Nocardioides hwasunensis]|uniref:5-formyltetrahydrofolate cyclo-ligase n=1 Tax=Nocardioides hwasunensis TaxID=397258 RepID=A0ABR8MPZ5_9ACTN|nr:5-formyltetrahydrofolate cyclo-ligase [Nocardioides hwasunensis]MBD3916942.1 5-formyltetrahydrofolate cyclo-ligase [Nocardioides hwasunensis]